MQKNEKIFAGAYENLNWLCQYTHTRPQNETKLDRLSYIHKKSVYPFIKAVW